MYKKFYSSSETYCCPKCNIILKEERKDDFFGFICVVLFIPVGLIALIVHFIKIIKERKAEFNEFGEQIIHCPNCQSVVAIHRGSSFGYGGYTRIVVQEKELLEMIKPLIDYLNTYYGISCAKYRNERKYSEMLSLRFENSLGKTCNVSLWHSRDLKVLVDNGAFELFDMKKLAFKIIDILNC